MPVGMIFDSGQSYAGRAYRDAIAAAHSHGVPIVLARRGMRWNSGDGVTLDVLAPAMPFLDDTGDDVNENSIVVMLHYRAFRELFMGDAGEASEARLLILCHPEHRRARDDRARKRSSRGRLVDGVSTTMLRCATP
jgi:beta-lactamase superfamily II metal-dependent hydrolase